MNLPQVLTDLVAAQNSSDSAAYANCFAETAIVLDEGKKHTGKASIKKWIAKANQEYTTKMRPLNFSAPEQILEAEISGSFPGSPIVITYQLTIKEGLIHSLKIG